MDSDVAWQPEKLQEQCKYLEDSAYSYRSPASFRRFFKEDASAAAVIEERSGSLVSNSPGLKRALCRQDLLSAAL